MVGEEEDGRKAGAPLLLGGVVTLPVHKLLTARKIKARTTTRPPQRNCARRGGGGGGLLLQWAAFVIVLLL